jgi:hypothetical protein
MAMKENSLGAGYAATRPIWTVAVASRSDSFGPGGTGRPGVLDSVQV